MSRPSARRTIENRLRRLGFAFVAGVDEVGRGCLAGPVVAASVVLDPGHSIKGVRDSKLLTSIARERLFEEIVASCVTWSVAVSDPSEIDRVNVHQASLLAMKRAVLKLDPSPNFVLVDGFRIPNLITPQRPLIKGDRRCTVIAAASILAKVTRDRKMSEFHSQDPRYGFNRNKGYGTRTHLEAIDRFGYSVIHRRSFRPFARFDKIG